MPDRYVDLREAPSVQDFIRTALEYLPARDQASYRHLLEDVAYGKKVSLERLVDMAKNVAIATWPARHALDRYVNGLGAEHEWAALMSVVRPSTALLLKKLRNSSGAVTVDQALASSDASLAIHDAEEVEIELARPEARLKVWQDQQKEIAPLITQAQTTLEAMKKRLKALRDQAVSSSKAAAQMLPRLESYEDRIYFGNEAIALEILDKELAFDAEDVAIPPTDDAMSGAEPLPIRFVVEETEETGEVTEEEKPKRGRKKKKEEED